MDDKKISKFLSYVLRHHPQEMGLSLEDGGWVKVSVLLDRMKGKGIELSLEGLQHIVATSDKKRFTFSDDGNRIRAAQGHSVKVNLDLQPTTPPAVLFHGTGEKWVHSILETGLQKRSRQHVHLSEDLATALAVGSRHGKPKVFRVDASAMEKDGYLFYCADNGVWLTDEVPDRYLQLVII